MFSIAEWTDRASALSYPKKLTSSASFSPSIRISLRLRIHQAQAKNFCRVLDIRVSQIVKSDLSKLICPKQLAEALCNIMGLDQIANLVDTDIFLIFPDVGPPTKSAVFRLLFLECQQPRFHKRNKRQRSHAGLCLRRIGGNQRKLSVNIA